MSQSYEPLAQNGYHVYAQAGPSNHARQHTQNVYMNDQRQSNQHLPSVLQTPQEYYNTPQSRPVHTFMTVPAGFQPPPTAPYHLIQSYQTPMTGPSYHYPDPHLVTPASGTEFRFGAPPEMYAPQNDGWNVEWEDDLVEIRDGQEIVYGNLEVSPELATAPSSVIQTPQTPKEDAFPSVPPPASPNYQVSKQTQDSKKEEKAELVSTTKVKHRRRTTPEQLKVLEHWFDINPKPDNALREWLAQELGMTKRNIQVWFQNRRAKVKGQMLKTKSNQSPEQEPHRPPAVSSQTMPMSQGTTLLSPVENVNMHRRVSLANGEAARIEAWAAKRAAAARKQEQPSQNLGLFTQTRMGMLQGQAAAARHGSLPYPSPIITTVDEDGRVTTGQQPSSTGPTRRPSNPNIGMSPKISPSPRPLSSALHLAAIRNNSRRASMPGTGIQLLSSGPFTPPRVVSNNHQTGVPRGIRELSPIKDHEDQHYPGESYTFAEYLTPPSTTYLSSTGSQMSNESDIPPSIGYNYTPHSSESSDDFSPNAPLPNPGFSFGSVPMNQAFVTPDTYPNGYTEDENAQGAFYAMRPGRMGSIASLNTDGGTTEGGSEYSVVDWTGLTPDGFAPDLRRASAPPDLLHNMGVLGINTFLPGQPQLMKPSPLGAAVNGTGNLYSTEMVQNSSNLSSTSNGLSPAYTSKSGGTPSESPAGPSPSSVNGVQHVRAASNIGVGKPRPQLQTYNSVAPIITTSYEQYTPSDHDTSPMSSTSLPGPAEKVSAEMRLTFDPLSQINQVDYLPNAHDFSSNIVNGLQKSSANQLNQQLLHSKSETVTTFDNLSSGSKDEKDPFSYLTSLSSNGSSGNGVQTDAAGFVM